MWKPSPVHSLLAMVIALWLGSPGAMAQDPVEKCASDLWTRYHWPYQEEAHDLGPFREACRTPAYQGAALDRVKTCLETFITGPDYVANGLKYCGSPSLQSIGTDRQAMECVKFDIWLPPEEGPITEARLQGWTRDCTSDAARDQRACQNEVSADGRLRTTDYDLWGICGDPQLRAQRAEIFACARTMSPVIGPYMTVVQRYENQQTFGMTSGYDARANAAYEFIGRCIRKPEIREVAADFAACVTETGRPDFVISFVASECEKPEFRRYHLEVRRCLDEADRLHRQRSQETVCESYIGSGPDAVCVNPHPRETYWGRPQFDDFERCEAAVLAAHLPPSPAPPSAGASVSGNSHPVPAPAAAASPGTGNPAPHAGTASPSGGGH